MLASVTVVGPVVDAASVTVVGPVVDASFCHCCWTNC